MYVIARRMRSSDVTDGSTPPVSACTMRRAASATSRSVRCPCHAASHAANSDGTRSASTPLGTHAMPLCSQRSVSARPSRVSGSTNSTALGDTRVASIVCGWRDGMIAPPYSVHGSPSPVRKRMPGVEPNAI